MFVTFARYNLNIKEMDLPATLNCKVEVDVISLFLVILFHPIFQHN